MIVYNIGTRRGKIFIPLTTVETKLIIPSLETRRAKRTMSARFFPSPSSSSPYIPPRYIERKPVVSIVRHVDMPFEYSAHSYKIPERIRVARGEENTQTHKSPFRVPSNSFDVRSFKTGKKRTIASSFPARDIETTLVEERHEDNSRKVKLARGLVARTFPLGRGS